MDRTQPQSVYRTTILSVSVRVATIQPNLPRAAHCDITITSEQRLVLLYDQVRSATDEGAQIMILLELSFNFAPQMEYTDERQSLAAETNA